MGVVYLVFSPRLLEAVLLLGNLLLQEGYGHLLLYFYRELTEILIDIDVVLYEELSFEFQWDVDMVVMHISQVPIRYLLQKI